MGRAAKKGVITHNVAPRVEKKERLSLDSLAAFFGLERLVVVRAVVELDWSERCTDGDGNAA